MVQRTQIPGRQVRDESIDTIDINDLAVTEDKLDTTGVAAGTYSKVTVSNKGRVFAGTNPSTLAGIGVSVNLDDLADVVITSAGPQQVLSYNGTNWINTPIIDVDGSLKLYAENPQNQIDAVAAGFNSIAFGSGAAAGSSNSFAFGDQSLSRIDGGMVFANGRFASQGDAQAGRYLMRSHTINATPTELFLNGTAGGERLTITDDTTWLFEINVIAHQQDGDGHAGFKLKGVLYKVGAVNTHILGAVTKDVIAAYPGWDVSVAADTVTSSLKITVKGEAGKIIRWFAIIATVEVTN